LKVLVGKCFGLGNAVMAIPMLKAIKSLPEVTVLNVLIGSFPDDAGTFDVLKHLKGTVIDHIYINSAIDGDHAVHDIAIMSIPFDGRWRNGHHYEAHRVIDGRTRPDPNTHGLISWKKHEIEYQMDNALELGFTGETPSMVFHPHSGPGYVRDIYFGVGYKKDEAGFWAQKHWGNNSFIRLAKLLTESFESCFIHSTGDILDWKMTLQPIEKEVGNKRFLATPSNLDEAFNTLSKCGLYIGNDTGMMHVAASMNIPCIAYFGMQNSKTKASPWGEGHTVLETASPEYVFEIAEGIINARS
jgi:ADP-heptose:LPS heptosyltransferase